MTRIGLILFLLLSIGSMQSQVRLESVDSSAVEYLQTVLNYSLLYYGAEYEGYPRTTNHPYLIDDQYTKARLSYKNVIYPEALLCLDLNRDELVIKSPGFRNIVLFPENVDFVELHGKYIIYFQKDSLHGCPSSGFYILLHSDKCKVLEKRNAQIMEKTSPGLFERYFDFSTRYYLYKDGVYYSIKNKRGLLKALQPYKKELKRFISSRKLNYKNDTEAFLIHTVNEYEQLTGF